jgi:predicted SpoU family rRNA methylase
MLGASKLVKKYNCVWKIRDKNTGLFSTGSSYPNWKKKGGKTWNRIGDLKCHLTMHRNNVKGIPDNWEVCEFRVSEPFTFDAKTFK